jgi:hypothetical protein
MFPTKLRFIWLSSFRGEDFSIKISYFVMIRLQAWPLQTILVTDWLISKKYSPLKLRKSTNQ